MKQIVYCLALFVGLTLIACNNHDDEAMNQEDNAIRFRAKVVNPTTSTRAQSGTESTLLNNSIGNGEKVRICFYNTGTDNPIITDEGTEASTNEPIRGRLYTANNRGELTADTEDPSWGSNNIDVYAYYPSTFWHNYDYDYYSVSWDQKNPASLKNTDILVAQATNIAKTSGPITLEFKHIMTKINVIIQSGSSGLTATNAKDVRIQCESDYYLEKRNGIIKVDLSPGNWAEIQLGDYTSASGLYGIIPPQTIDKNESNYFGKFISFKINDVTYSYMPDSPIELKSGYEYTFTLTIDNSTVKAKSFSVSPWEGSLQECSVSGNAKI